jgi:steroid 5-alpha reductase family enzyme
MPAGIALSAGAAFVVFIATWAVGRALGRYNVVDITWGLAFVVIAIVAMARTRDTKRCCRAHPAPAISMH